MKRMHVRPALFLILFGASVFVAGCGDDPTDPDTDKLTGITNSDDAETFVRWLMDGVIQSKVISGLSNGDHNQTVVTGGMGGKATLTGSKSYRSGISCGSSCVRSETNNNLTIVFKDFRVMSPGNVEALVSGTITYTDNTWSRQSSLSYSSGGSVTGKGSGVSATFNVDDGEWGYQDKVTFNVSAYKGNLYALTGTCSSSSGTYSF